MISLAFQLKVWHRIKKIDILIVTPSGSRYKLLHSDMKASVEKSLTYFLDVRM